MGASYIPFLPDGSDLAEDDFSGGNDFSSPNFLTSSWDTISDWFTGKNTNTAGMTPAMASTAQTGQMTKNLGLLTSALGGISSAIGTYYAAQSAQYQEKSQASSYAFQSDMASINASRQEMAAESIEEAGKTQIASYTMQAGEEKSAAVAKMGASGVAIGVGSSADVLASMDIQKDLNVLAINSNTTRQAWAAREQATDYRNESLLDRTSSASAIASASSISPMGSAMNSLLGSATKVSSRWSGYNRWLQLQMAQGTPATQIGIGG